MNINRFRRKSDGKISIPEGYTPSVNETYMCALHLEYFKRRLTKMKQGIIDSNSMEALSDILVSTNERAADAADMVAIDNNAEFEISRSSGDLNLLQNIDESLKLIDTKEYGFCQETGQKIGIKRMLVNPVAKFCIEIQEEMDFISSKHKFSLQNRSVI